MSQAQHDYQNFTGREHGTHHENTGNVLLWAMGGLVALLFAIPFIGSFFKPKPPPLGAPADPRLTDPNNRGLGSKNPLGGAGEAWQVAASLREADVALTASKQKSPLPEEATEAMRKLQVKSPGLLG